MSNTTQATLRTAHLGEVTQLIDIYQQAAHELPAKDADNLLPRPFDEVNTAVRNGLFFVIEDEQHEFLAGAGVFDLSDPDYKELGMAYVRPRAQGWGLQGLLLQVRVCVATLAQVVDEITGKRYAHLITAIKPTNLRSLDNVRATGFTPITESVPCLIEPCIYCKTGPGTGRWCCCEFLSLADLERARAIENALQLQRWEKTRSRAGDSIRVEFALRALADPDYRAALEDILSDLKRRTISG